MADGHGDCSDGELEFDQCEDGYDEYDGSLYNDWWGSCDRRRSGVDEVGAPPPPPENSRYALLAGAVAVTALIGLLSLPSAITASAGAPPVVAGDVAAGPILGQEAARLAVALAAENGGPGDEVPVTTADPDARAQAAITFAMAQIGIPYVWGGDGPASGEGGFDCSGLTKAAYASAGIDLPRTAHTQFYAGPHVPADADLKPGDLVFYGTPQRVHHVGLYLGGGRMVNAPHTGALVQVASARWAGDDYLGATRPAAGPGSLITGPIGAVVVPATPGPTPPVTDEFVAPPAPLPPAAAVPLPAAALPVAPAPAPVAAVPAAPAVLAPPAAAPVVSPPATVPPAVVPPPAASTPGVPSPTTPPTTPPVTPPTSSAPSPASSPPPSPPSVPVVVPPAVVSSTVSRTSAAVTAPITSLTSTSTVAPPTP
jgi:cell wall-associated NlpC family hydrolase